MLQTEFDFTLPRGFISEEGTLHCEGKMRLATAADEIFPLKDSRVQTNPEYLIILILSRVVTQIGSLHKITPEMVEQFFVQDLTYLQDLYNRINQIDTPTYEGDCPDCGKMVKIPINFQQARR